MYGGWYEYAEGTEPQTHRTFVVEYCRNMLQKGTAKVYERFGPLLFPCGVPEYSGNLALDELDAEYASVYISEEQQAITVSLFIYGPRFHIPLKLPEGTAKTAESYSTGLRQKYMIALTLTGAYVLLYVIAWCVIGGMKRRTGQI